MPVVEFLQFTASEKLISDRTIANPLLDILKGTEGQISTFYGIQVEDEKTGYLVVVWETYEHHKKLTESPSYKDLLDAFKPLYTGEFTIRHIPCEVDPHTAFTAPTTEFALLRPNGVGKEACQETIGELFQLMVTCPGIHLPMSWGVSREDSEAYYMIFGWDNVEAHVNAIHEERLQPMVHKMKEIFQVISVGHVKLTKHE
ncbi:hypothetical protein AMATHDRAFT_882 [Amanita thiersii Skay4041]|uniref:ABM domain-containing protein n=1 Tax=Amanita thiersii Skay4041 TaxID=703135 RepID=A0A2A9NU83_9AGAR|nr:hypothetical protein AMATHDRAFT_882 [Amanita thiersii Skay4041]